MEKRMTNTDTKPISQFELCKSIYSSGVLTNIKMKNTAKLVLIALANHYNADREDMFPSQKYLANQLGISEKSVERAVAELSSLKIIFYETRNVNHYKFTNYFFELVGLSENPRQNVGSQLRQNVGQTNNMKQIKNSRDKKGFGTFGREYLKEPPAAKVPSVEETKQLLEKYKKDGEDCSSPLDLCEKEAIKWLNGIPRIIQNSMTARLLRKKYGLTLVNGENVKVKAATPLLEARL